MKHYLQLYNVTIHPIIFSYVGCYYGFAKPVQIQIWQN